MAVAAASGLSEETDFVRAAEEAAGRAIERLGATPDLVVIFLGAACRGDLAEGLAAAQQRTPGAPLLGCTAFGVLTEEGEVEGGQGASAIVFSGLHAAPTALRRDATPDEAALRLLLPGPSVFGTELCAGLPAGAPWVGGVPGGSGGVAWGPWRAEVEGVLSAGLSAPGLEAVVGVTQGCRPVTPFCQVTRVEGHEVLDIDGRPALPVLLGAMPERVRNAALSHGVPLLVAVGHDGARFLVRNLLGADAETGSIRIGDRLREGDRIAFAVRDAAAARDDLGAMLSDVGDRLRGRTPIAGLYFNCVARGKGLYGTPGIDAGFIGGALGGAPLCGFFGNGEVGTIGGRALPFSYTGVLAVLAHA